MTGFHILDFRFWNSDFIDLIHRKDAKDTKFLKDKKLFSRSLH
jgi:hypothetical protein